MRMAKGWRSGREGRVGDSYSMKPLRARGLDLGAADWNSIVGSSGYVELECLDGPSR